jgi:nucleotide-binding universal stress UspA family protein
MSRYPVFRSIVVPVDGSSLAEGAIPYALALAERTQSQVRFVLVHPGQYPPLLIDSARVYLAELTERFRTRLGASLSSIILNGPAASGLVQHVRDIGADLVVMTTHGRSGIERAWLGSVADEVIRSIEVPVIVLRPKADGTFPAFDMREILVPLDGSALAETAIGPAAVLAKLWDAEMSLVQLVYPVLFTPDAVLPFAGAYDEEMTAREWELAKDCVRDLSATLRAKGIRASGTALMAPRPVAESLIDLAQPARVSLVALATHGRGGLRRLVLGSVADKVVRGAQVPILVIPALWATRQDELRGAGKDGAADAGEELAHV